MWFRMTPHHPVTWHRAFDLLKKLDGLHSFDYAERLPLHGLKRLEERRILSDLLFAYKLLFGFTPLNVHDFFTPSRCTGTRRHAYKLFLTRCTTDVRKHFFCNRVDNIWSQLPSNTDFTSITSFRRALNGFNLTIPIVIVVICYMVLNMFITVFFLILPTLTIRISGLCASGIALQLPMSRTISSVFAVSQLLSHLLYLLMYNKQ